MQVLEPHDEAGVVQRLRSWQDRGGLDEEIEILGLAIDAGVLVDRVGAGDDEWDACRVERLERAAIDFALLFRDPEVAVGQRLSLFGRQAPSDGDLSGWARHYSPV